ncbi:MAG: class I SAM-dependent methyltransferase [Candidatus Altiarchaeota archaeon]
MGLVTRQRFALPLIRGSSVLDIGCAGGLLLRELKNRGISVKGVEIDSASAGKCSAKGFEVVAGNIEELDVKSIGSFDTVVMTDVIEHLHDPVAALVKLKAAIKPGGRLVLTTPNVDWLFWHLYHTAGGTPHAWINPEHIQFYNRKTIGEVLAKAGYELVGENSYGKVPLTGIHFRSPWAFLSCNLVVAASPKD